MRIFFDTEFIEDGKTIELISIGAVREDGAELYLENAECDLSRASPWVRDNVISKLEITRGLNRNYASRGAIRDMLLQFAGNKPEFWAYYADYDWVVLCQLFGRMIDLPKGWPMYCRDLKQLADHYTIKLPKQTGADEHNALADAKWAQGAFNYIASHLRGTQHEACVSPRKDPDNA